MYLADYHTHCQWSMDSTTPMADMALAAAELGMKEICFTDHVEPYESGTDTYNVYDFPALHREYEQAMAAAGDRIIIRRGVELGEAPRNYVWSEDALRQLGELDFIIGSIHQLGAEFGHEDLLFAASGDREVCHRQIRDYLELVLRQAEWGKFSVLGHLTLPLRYMNEVHHAGASFDGFEAEVEEIFRKLIEKGCGIEVNTNRGGDFLPGEKWLRLYRQCGGEIITMGTDAHRTAHVGRGIREAAELLRHCGFKAGCTYERLQPVFHDL